MTTIDDKLDQLQDSIDELTSTVEKLIDERNFLNQQLSRKRHRAQLIAEQSDDHLQEDWLGNG